MEVIRTRKLICVCAFHRHFKSVNVNKTGHRYISVFTDPLLYKTGYGTGKVARVQADLDEDVVDHLKSNNLKAKDHPGVFHLSKVSLPENITTSVEKILMNEKVKEIAAGGDDLRDYLWSRHLPIEDENLRNKMMRLEEEVRKKDEVMLPFLSADETLRLEQSTRSKVFRRLYHSTYNWKPINFTKRLGLQYLMSRSTGEYASLSRIFNEISKRDKEFQPKSLCDFGSGVGTVTWAARQYWASCLKEHLCADISMDMNILAERILRGGCKNNDHEIPALFFRQSLPESYKIQYDLVVSAYSLFEPASSRVRLEIIDKLWKKTVDGGYLVIVENGTRAGFQIVVEARDYLLRLDRPAGAPAVKCLVFSPCPASKQCPRFAFDTIPCNFEIKYRPLYPFHVDDCMSHRFCYVVLKKGFENPHEEKWPRMVGDRLKRSGHVICRMCTKDSKISEVVLTRAKHSMDFRVLAKRTRWGDLFPVHLTEQMQKEIDYEQEASEYDDSEPEPNSH